MIGLIGSVLQRRFVVGGIAALGIALISTLSLLQRRSAGLEEATRAEVLAHMSEVQQATLPMMERAETHLHMTYAQREAWLPGLDQLMIAAAYDTPERPDRMLDKLHRLNDYFRPLIELTPLISSIMVAREDEFEALFFRDRDANRLKPPYDFYNRVVWNAEFDDTVFEAFWEHSFEGRANLSRGRFLHEGNPGVRGVEWTGYVPSKRIWFEQAIAKEAGESTWTGPHLLPATKDAGVTGSLHFTKRGKRYVLAMDFVLTDLSRATIELQSDRFLAAIVTMEGRLVGLPRDPRFDTPEKVRRFFSEFNRQLSARSAADAEARLPTPKEAKLPLLVAAMENGEAREGTYQFDYHGRRLWAGRAPVGPSQLGLSLHVVELPVRRGS